jgi:hypothetical protein
MGASYSDMVNRLLTMPGTPASDLPAIREGILRLAATEPEPPAILAAKEGDLIEVIQPDGERETYRLASAEPSEDGIMVTFHLEPVP